MFQFGSAARANGILQDIANRWEQDPERAKKLTWEGLDNSESQEDDYCCCKDVCDCDYSPNSPAHYSDNLTDFIVPDSVTDEIQDSFESLKSIPAPNRPAPRPMTFIQQSAAPAPPPILIGTVALPHIQESDMKTSNDNDANCSICAIRESKVAIIPCGHGHFCLPCLHEYLSIKQNERTVLDCPDCRREIQQIIRIYR